MAVGESNRLAHIVFQMDEKNCVQKRNNRSHIHRTGPYKTPAFGNGTTIKIRSIPVDLIMPYEKNINVCYLI